MKQNKRFWLAAVAVLLIATMMVSGLAFAGQTETPTAFVTQILGYDRTAGGAPQTEYTFYGYHRQVKKNSLEFKDEWAGLVSSTATTDPKDEVKTIDVALGTEGKDGIRFNYRDSRDPSEGTLVVDESFFFESSNQTALAVAAYDATKKQPTAAVNTTLTWDGKTTGTFTLTIYAANGVRDFSKLDKSKAAKETFTIKIAPMTVTLKVTNKRQAKDNGIFNFNLYEDVDANGRAWDKKTIQIAETFSPKFDYGKQKYEVTAYANGKLIGFVYDGFKKELVLNNRTIPKTVAFDLVYSPKNAATIDEQFAAKVEADVAGFTFKTSGDDVGTFEKIATFAQKDGRFGPKYPARPGTYMDWNDKTGTVKVEITAVDEDAVKVPYIGSDTATLNFNLNQETEIKVNTTIQKDGKTVDVPVTVNEEDMIDIYNLPYYQGQYKVTTQVIITDEEGNGIEPTYANGYADIIWSSSDPSIMNVSKDGIITGVKAGKAYLIGKGNYKTVKVPVEVLPKQSTITKIEFNQDPAEYKIAKGASKPINAYILTVPHDTVDYYVESSDPDILRVVKSNDEPYSYDTFLYGNREGTVTVTVTPKGQPKKAITATFHVVDELETISFNKETYSFPVNTYGTLYVKVAPLSSEFSLYNEYQVIVGDTDIAYVYDIDDDDIEVYGRKAGKTTITIVNKYDKTHTATANLVIEPIKAESIKLKKDTIKLNFVDINKDDVAENSVSFTNYVKFTPSAAQVTPVADYWDFESDNDGVAIVSTTGYIEPTGIGTAVITGTYDDGVNKAELKLTVVVKGAGKVEPEPEPEPEPAKSNPIVVEPEDGNYYINVVKGAKNTKQLTAYDAVTGEEVDVKWTSADLKMATVSKNGLMTAKGKGRAVITATTADGTQSYKIGITLNQKPVEQINVLDKKVELKVGEKFIVGASVYPKHAYNQELGYKSSNKKVVTVDKGILTAKKAGTATITVSAKDGSGVTATFEVTVTK